MRGNNKSAIVNRGTLNTRRQGSVWQFKCCMVSFRAFKFPIDIDTSNTCLIKLDQIPPLVVIVLHCTPHPIPKRTIILSLVVKRSVALLRSHFMTKIGREKKHLKEKNTNKVKNRSNFQGQVSETLPFQVLTSYNH